MADVLDLAKQLELSQAESKLVNEAIFERLDSRDPAMIKQAESAVNEFTRVFMREYGFARGILPPIPIQNSDLDRLVSTDKPIKIVDKEPGSPAAVSVPFNTQPETWYILGPRYMVTFDRILTSRFTKDVDELRTWIMDIRQVLSDNSIKDMMAEEDTKFLNSVNSSIVGANTVVPTSGVVQYQTIPGAITRDGLWEMLMLLPNTPSRLETHTVLTNTITIKHVAKMGRTEFGGDLAQDIMKSGWTYQEFMNTRFLITIKIGLVGTGTFYLFADPKFMGKHYELEATTMSIKREDFMIEFFAYRTAGMTIGNTNSVARQDFLL